MPVARAGDLVEDEGQAPLGARGVRAFGQARLRLREPHGLAALDPVPEAGPLRLPQDAELDVEQVEGVLVEHPRLGAFEDGVVGLGDHEQLQQVPAAVEGVLQELD